jgi:hypothetical protein
VLEVLCILARIEQGSLSQMSFLTLQSLQGKERDFQKKILSVMKKNVSEILMVGSLTMIQENGLDELLLRFVKFVKATDLTDLVDHRFIQIFLSWMD